MRPPPKGFATGFQILIPLPWPITIRRDLKVLKRESFRRPLLLVADDLIYSQAGNIACRDGRCLRYGHQPDHHDQSPLWLSTHGPRNGSHLQQRNERLFHSRFVQRIWLRPIPFQLRPSRETSPLVHHPHHRRASFQLVTLPGRRRRRRFKNPDRYDPESLARAGPGTERAASTQSIPIPRSIVAGSNLV